MDKDELKEFIEITLKKESNDLRNNLYPWKLEKKNGITTIKYPNSDTLINVYSNIQNNGHLKKEFINILSQNIASSEETDILNVDPPIISGSYSVSVYTLIKLGFTEEAISALEKRSNNLGLLITFLWTLLDEDYNYFTNKQLGKLLKVIEALQIGDEPWLRPLNMFKRHIETKLINNRFEIVNKEIRGVNLEINQDKKMVSEKITYLDFEVKYNELLNEIDKYINTESSNVLNSCMISNLRVFMHDIIIDIAKNISTSKSEDIPKTAESKIGDARNYIKDKLRLSENDHKFINSFINILHDEGGHSFLANKEYFRLARNIAIEITLLLLSKYEKINTKN